MLAFKCRTKHTSASCFIIPRDQSTSTVVHNKVLQRNWVLNGKMQTYNSCNFRPPEIIRVKPSTFDDVRVIICKVWLCSTHSGSLHAYVKYTLYLIVAFSYFLLFLPAHLHSSIPDTWKTLITREQLKIEKYANWPRIWTCMDCPFRIDTDNITSSATQWTNVAILESR